MPSFREPQIENLASGQHVEAFLWDIEETPQKLLSMLPDCFNYKEECANFRSTKRCQEWLAVRVLLHCEAAITSSVQYGKTGKPFLIGKKQFIGISHSSNYVCLALAEFPFGIDIEQRGGKAWRLREKFLKEKEWNLLSQTTLSEEDASTLSWSAKEAVYKMVESFSPSLYDEIQINRINTDKRCLEISVSNSKEKKVCDFYVVEYVISQAFVFTLAIKNN